MKNPLNLKKGNIVKARTGILALIVCAMLLSSVSCPNPVQRGGSSYDGSVKWALNIAQPLINSFSSDAQVYSILGAMVYRDGRLPSNTGDWSFVAWSPSRQETFQVTVLYDSSTKTSTRSEATAPGATGNPLPAGWVNSTVIFNAAAPHFDSGVRYAKLVVFNVTDYPQSPGQAVWGMNLNTGPNQLVNWDGTYIGTQ